MNYRIGDYILRRGEPADLEALYRQKNDPEIALLLGGFSLGYSMADLSEWLEFHGKQSNEALWIVAEATTDLCVGHVGLYQIDHRIRSAEFAIMLGERRVWGRGLGKACTKFALEFGIRELNLNRIHLTVLATNQRAANMYRRVGFQDEGRLRQAQYKNGQHIDLLVMSCLREEYLAGAPV